MYRDNDYYEEENLFLPADGRIDLTHKKEEEEEEKKSNHRWSGRIRGNWLTGSLEKGRSAIVSTKMMALTDRQRELKKYCQAVGESSSDEDDDEDELADGASRRCTVGTAAGAGVWFNHRDRVGVAMALLVWTLMGYSAFTVLLLARHRHLSAAAAASYCTVVALALASHAKTCLTDPGAVPPTALPPSTTATTGGGGGGCHVQCAHCHTFKPATAHHCRICNRCVSRMDHHCPWMNNCIGATNLKHFVLFLLYTWLAAALALALFAANYFLCASEACAFAGPEIHLVRAMTCLCLGAWLFVGGMLTNVARGVVTGVGTVDRLRKRAAGRWHGAAEEPVPLRRVVGAGPVWTWWLPVDPVFDDAPDVLGYSTKKKSAKQQHRRRRSPYSEEHEEDVFRQKQQRGWNGLEPLLDV
jgi:hypothetical protein